VGVELFNARIGFTGRGVGEALTLALQHFIHLALQTIFGRDRQGRYSCRNFIELN